MKRLFLAVISAAVLAGCAPSLGTYRLHYSFGTMSSAVFYMPARGTLYRVYPTHVHEVQPIVVSTPVIYNGHTSTVNMHQWPCGCMQPVQDYTFVTWR